MAVCANCSRELQPEWKFCIYCGTPTGVPVAASVVARAEAAEAADAADAPTTTMTVVNATAATESADVTPASAETAAEPDVLRAEDIPDDEPAPSLRPRATPPTKINILAVLALILGCLVSPLAALFGHLALNQISRTGERGTAIAWVAIVLGYLSLAALLVLGISYLVLNA